MEIVPILSTIILIGTIITFILAIAAYIIYKRRERSGGGASGGTAQPQPHVLVTPQTTAQQLPQAQPAANYLPPAQGQTVTLQDSYSQQYSAPQYANPSVSVNVDQGHQEPPVQVNVQSQPARALPPAQQQSQPFWQDQPAYAQQPAYTQQGTYQGYEEQPFQRQPLPQSSQPQANTPQARLNDDDDKNDAWL
ncbi:MAG: hypothetical protein RhofKO_26620 [Rhodothermales bacterium]